MKSLNSVVDIFYSQYGKKTAVGYRKVHFLSLTKTVLNTKWTYPCGLWELYLYITAAYLIDFVVNNYN
ncbi:hypothetical protein FML24_20860 [Klebsiella oxytoca]|nr:hypothetical protein [Klebsiella oxytoca]MBZ7069074.1 hypothetical protein [Klebsiella oxytoca]MBZ7153207.1 hypothetical protein [Klebsiella oxytoca]MBZ7165129.1 hypothetical protein [Klebsiella oxytoca]MBZ7190372.1 hypothetical protein [Klebsiella oxytoca]